MPKYYYHPVPYALSRHLNETRHCLPYRQRYGHQRSCSVLQRAVTNRICWGAKLGWRELALTLTETLREDRWLGEDAAHFLPAIANIYRRCFGLKPSAKCPRTVGDRHLFHGAEDPCLRKANNGSCHQSESMLPTVDRQIPKDSKRTVGARQELGFECVSEGLRLMRRAGLTARPEGQLSTPLASRPGEQKP